MKTLSFPDLGLSKELARAITDLGFEEPTPIQALAIPMMREGRDVIGQAHTGTGKTAAYGVPLLETIDPKDRHVQALVMCPTRELAIQVSEELAKLAKYLHGVVIIPVYGGQPIERQTCSAQQGSPGRHRDTGPDPRPPAPEVDRPVDSTRHCPRRSGRDARYGVPRRYR